MPDIQRKSALARASAPDDALAGMGDPAPAQADPPAPRGRRRRANRTPFTSTMAADVREAVDQHVDQTGETIASLIDRLLRAELGLPPAPRR